MGSWQILAVLRDVANFTFTNAKTAKADMNFTLGRCLPCTEKNVTSQLGSKQYCRNGTAARARSCRAVRTTGGTAPPGILAVRSQLLGP